MKSSQTGQMCDTKWLYTDKEIVRGHHAHKLCEVSDIFTVAETSNSYSLKIKV